jgi:hypothetical protein
MHLLCRNRVAHYSKWKAVFTSHTDAHCNAGLRLVRLWRDVADPKNVFFLFEVESAEKAKEFISNPDAATAAKASGVIEGEYHLLEDAGGY